MNKFKKIKKVKIKLVDAILAYTDYLIANGAKKIDINTKGGFSIHSDIGLSIEQLKSKEFQTITRNLAIALSK